MKTKPIYRTAVMALAVSFPVCGFSAVSQQEALQLEDKLTPLGAERAGNQDGSIPAWKGGLTSAPDQFKPGSHMVNPFDGDEVLVEITADNVDQYADFLSDGQRALFERYPDTYKMRIYPSRRTAHVPDWVVQHAADNATRAKLTNDGNGVDDYEGYYPFPIPASANEVLWNHFMRFRGGSLRRSQAQVITQASGAYSVVGIDETVVWPERLEGFDPAVDSNTMNVLRQLITEPARLTGNILLVHETVDQVKEPRQAWTYNSGQRRVLRAPEVAYDGPGTAADGQRTTDNVDMYSGSPDRYDWKLVGKQELYIPYNNYQLTEKTSDYKDLITKGHLNPDYLRYEKHRVWKVVGTTKAGIRHIYAKRVFYIDEDTWQIALAEQFDRSGGLWRVSEGYHVQFYEDDVPWLAAEAIYDLVNGRYIVNGLHSASTKPVEFGFTERKSQFTPAAIRRLGR